MVGAAPVCGGVAGGGGGGGDGAPAVGARALRRRPRGRSPATALAFVTAYAFTAYGRPLPNVVAGGAWSDGGWRGVRGATPWLIVYSIVDRRSAGPLFEACWSALGFFHYHSPDLLGVPCWLPGIYLHVAFLAAGLETLVGNRGGRQ